MTTYSGSAFLFGRGSFSAPPRLRIDAGTVSLAGAGSLTAAASLFVVVLTATSTAAFGGLLTANVSVVSRGNASLSADGLRTAPGEALLGASGSLSVRATPWAIPGSPAAVLPPSAGVFDRLAVATATEPLPVPVREVLDPAETPARFLPFLAFHESVDLWFSDWSEARKRAVVAAAPDLARRKGTRSGSEAFLAFVDTELLDAVAFPAPFVFGRAKVRRTPIGHPAFVARYLLKTETRKPPRALVFRRGSLASARVRSADRDPLRRALVALRAAKAPETEIRADFAHKRELRISDAPPLDGTFRLGEYLDRVRL